VRYQLAADRGRVTLRRCVATLSSALTDAVRQHRLTHNPARNANIPGHLAASESAGHPRRPGP